MSEKQALKNNQQLKQISADLSSISKDILLLKESIKDIQSEVRKINMIEDKIKKGESIQKSNDGWFLWS
jgi:prefoldin subunit 5